jgi:hypothetical protein
VSVRVGIGVEVLCAAVLRGHKESIKIAGMNSFRAIDVVSITIIGHVEEMKGVIRYCSK